MNDPDFFVQTGYDQFIPATMSEWVSWLGRSGRELGAAPSGLSAMRRLVAETAIGSSMIVLTEFFGVCEPANPTPTPWRSTIYTLADGRKHALPMTSRYASRTEAEAGHDRTLALLSSPEFASPEHTI